MVHNRFLWLGKPIPITNMSIHRIMKLTHKGTDPSKEFGGEIDEKELADKMEKEYGLVKKLCGYSILSIQDLELQFDAQILASKIMKKCHLDEVRH